MNFDPRNVALANKLSYDEEGAQLLLEQYGHQEHSEFKRSCRRYGYTSFR